MEHITHTEKEMITLIANGFQTKEIAIWMKFTVPSVETYRHNLYIKCGVRNAAELVAYAFNHEILKPFASVKGNLTNVLSASVQREELLNGRKDQHA